MAGRVLVLEGGAVYEQEGWVLIESRLGLCGTGSWFGRFGAFGYDARVCREWAVGAQHVVVVLGCVWRVGSCSRPPFPVDKCTD